MIDGTGPDVFFEQDHQIAKMIADKRNKWTEKKFETNPGRSHSNKRKNR